MRVKYWIVCSCIVLLLVSLAVGQTKTDLYHHPSLQYTRALKEEARSSEQPRFIGSLFESFIGYFKTGINVLLGRGAGTRNKRMNYRKYQLLRAFPRTDGQLDEVEAMEGDGVKFWTPPLRNRSVDMLIPPNIARQVKTYLEQKTIDYEIVIRDVQVSERTIFTLYLKWVLFHFRVSTTLVR